MEEPDLYDDILAGTLSPSRVPGVEALLEIGVHRRVLRLPERGCPLQSARDAVSRLLTTDAGLRAAVGTAQLVFQRRSLKFDTWVDIEPGGERPVADGERLRALVVPLLEAGELVSSEGETDDRRRRRASDSRRHTSRRHRSSSADGGRRRHRRRRHRRHSSSDASSSASSGEGESDSRRRQRRRRRRREYSSSRSRRRRSWSRSSSSRFGSSRSRSRSRRRSSSGSDSSRRSDSRFRRKNSARSSSGARQRSPVPSKRRIAPPASPVHGRHRPGPATSRAAAATAKSATAWQHMDPEFAEQLRMYEIDRAKQESKAEFRRQLSDLVDVSEGELSSSGPATPKERKADQKEDSGKMKDMSDLGLRVLDRLKKLREQLGGVDSACKPSDEEKSEKSERAAKDEDSERMSEPEPVYSKGGRVYAAYLNLESKHPVMALHEYCTARQWDAPFFHLTETSSDGKKQHLYTAAVRVNQKMYTMPQPVQNKKDGKRGAALYCLQTLGVLKNDHGDKQEEFC